MTLCFLLLLLLFNLTDAISSDGRRLNYTEEREECRSYNPMKRALFGDVHVHTSRSLDAATQDARTTPYQAYQFALGKRISLHPWIPNSKEGKINIKNTFLKKGESFNKTPKFDAKPSRSLQLGRPLDFTMVSDHAEFFGELRVCGEYDPNSKGYKSKACKKLRKNFSHKGMNLIESYLGGARIKQYTHNDHPLKRHNFCGKNGKDCKKGAKVGWKEVIDSAESVYDRTEDCNFTSFIGYEYTLSPLSWNLHRNVLFRNNRVPDYPVSAMDAKHPEALWDKLIKDCIENDKLKNKEGKGCDVLAIPHNSNMSNARMFERKVRSFFNKEGANQKDFTKEYAQKRARLEPLIEVFQHKGDSECHYYKAGSMFRQKPKVNNPDEFCQFEKMPYNNLTADKENMFEKWLLGDVPFIFSWYSTYPKKTNFIREALKRGLQLKDKLEVNPFKYGFIGSTDTHIGAPGATNEINFKGHGGAGASNQDKGKASTKLGPDGFPNESQPNGLADFMSYGPGGLAVVWSEENSRDYIFDALRRKETYGTSGTRIALRFFGGWDFKRKEANKLCENVKFSPNQVALNGGDFVRAGYEKGVPMGSDLPSIKERVNKAPTFLLAALKDPGFKPEEQENAGSLREDLREKSTPLKVIQIIKGWVDESGKTHEKVYDISGVGKKNEKYNLNSCEEVQKGPSELCGFWKDPDFNPNERAFYYARVIEKPVCRWSWHQCVGYVRNKHPKMTPTNYFLKNCSKRRLQKKIPKGFRGCCRHVNVAHKNPKVWEKTQFGTYTPFIYERAWSSPIWYGP